MLACIIIGSSKLCFKGLFLTVAIAYVDPDCFKRFKQGAYRFCEIFLYRGKSSRPAKDMQYFYYRLLLDVMPRDDACPFHTNV